MQGTHKECTSLAAKELPEPEEKTDIDKRRQVSVGRATVEVNTR